MSFTLAIKKVSGTLKLLYSQYRELQSFAQFGSDLDADTKARLAQGERIVEVLKQSRDTPIDVEKQVAILYAVTHDYLREIVVGDIKAYEEGLYSFLDSNANGRAAMDAIRTTKDLGKDAEQALVAALDTYTATFRQTH